MSIRLTFVHVEAEGDIAPALAAFAQLCGVSTPVVLPAPAGN